MPRNDELVQAANAGDLATVKRLIEAGADPNSVDQYGMGALLTFHPEVTRFLLEHGADPDVQRNENINPVIAGVCGDVECLRLMLEAGADPNLASDHNGEVALHFVASGECVDSVKLLLKHGADPNLRTKPGMRTYGFWRDARVKGETPLHRAAAFCSPEVIQLLLDAGADPTIRDANNDTPLSWASWYNRDKSVIDQLYYEGSGIGPDYDPTARPIRSPAISQTFRIDCDMVTDWDSFHAVSALVFEFPDYYGRNMDAWIDCVSDFDSPVVIQLERAESFRNRRPEIYAAIVEGSSFVNWRMIEAGDKPLVFLSMND